MGNIIKRMVNSVKADLNEMLDKKEQKNPIALLNQYLRQCEQEAEKVRGLIERQSILKEEFLSEYAHARELAEKRKYQAEIVARAGETELHEFAVGEHILYEERAVHLKQAAEEATMQLEELERKYEEMKHKIKDYSIKRMELMGRENVARAKTRINKVLEPSDHFSQPFTNFEGMERYLNQLENKVNTSYYRSTIDARVNQLEKELKNNEIHSIPQ